MVQDAEVTSLQSPLPIVTTVILQDTKGHALHSTSEKIISTRQVCLPALLFHDWSWFQPLDHLLNKGPTAGGSAGGGPTGQIKQTKISLF
jgi:hypothetical protein